MEKLIYGAAYYDEYMPYERLDTDMKMMKKAGINTIRIAESTWSTEEPEDGVFDFSHVTKVLEACEANGINVIVGTPTYAIPAWLAEKYPEIMVTDSSGKRPYGARQIMDITHPVYRYYSERIIRRLMEAVSGYSCVIGYQLDNETKHYGTSSENVQKMFAAWVKKKFNGDIEAMNRAFGLDYWSNRINSWEQFPNVSGTINASLGSEFEKFQRNLVTEFLKWQGEIVREYSRPDQFITHNFDFAWKGHSYGIQPDVDHPAAAKALTIAGCDIYHPSQNQLTGKEIAFGGDVTRSLRKDNYLVIETEAQGFAQWTPFKGQLRLQAFSHLASGADSVMYWHWHSIHNAIETYWKGILSHDLKENAIYREVCTIGRDFAGLSSKLVNLKKKNRAAVMVSNESLTAMKWFERAGGSISYNDVVRWVYDALFEMNVECDIIWPWETELSQYDIIFVPALYSAQDDVLERLENYAEQGGTLAATFKSGFADENVKVRTVCQPGGLSRCMGVCYDRFTIPADTYLSGDDFELTEDERKVTGFMELIEECTGEIISGYDHSEWKEYAAVTESSWGKGHCYYIGAMTTSAYLKKLIERMLKEKDMWSWKQNEAPAVIKEGRNEEGSLITYIFNYSSEKIAVSLPDERRMLLKGKGETVSAITDRVELEPWDFCIVEKTDNAD